LSYSWFQTSQTGGQQYSDTSPTLVFPALVHWASTTPVVLAAIFDYRILPIQSKLSQFIVLLPHWHFCWYFFSDTYFRRKYTICIFKLGPFMILRHFSKFTEMISLNKFSYNFLWDLWSHCSSPVKWEKIN
jgi:hypothetical protein